MRLTVICLAILIAGCATTYERYQFGELQQMVWKNPSLAEIPQPKLQLEFSKTKGACNVEAYKLPVPSPSCVQPPKDDCTGKTGFALGFCQSYTPPMKCDYSAVNAASQAREEIFSSCMQANGWNLESSPGRGSDIAGGTFEYVAYDNQHNYYVRLGSVSNRDNTYTAVVRQVPKGSNGSAYQGLFVFDAVARTLQVDGDKPVAIANDSAARFILDRIIQLSRL